ncbi:MAG: hypothetical protein H0S82_00495 [Anaerolineaceae bacterium]|nr:hypothetical protein [Anaerolineaceae bacterium]
MTPKHTLNPQDDQDLSDVQRVNRYPKGNLFTRLFRVELRAEAVVNLDDVIGEIDPRIYGHFIGDPAIFGLAGRDQDAAVEELFKALNSPVCRYRVGVVGSEADGIALDAFLAFCEKAGAKPYLTLDPETMAAEDAARWVGQCRVPLWELEGPEDGSSAAGYVQSIRPFITAMRAVNPAIQLVAAGKMPLPGDPQDAEDWNRTVLAGVGSQIDYLSFSVYHPDETGRLESVDPETWHHSLLSAPHGVEEAIQRMAELNREVVPDRQIGLVLDGFNVRPPTNGGSPTGTLQEALYVAGMLNVFQRQCEVLKVACLAQGAEEPPMIVKPEGHPAFPTPLYFPYLLYQTMESQLLSPAYWSPVFQAKALGENIRERNQVPYLDITATRSVDGQRVVLGITNRSPLRQAKVMINLKGEGNRKFRVTAAQLMEGPDALASNTVDAPERVSVRPIRSPRLRFAWLDLDLPPASLMVVELERKA